MEIPRIIGAGLVVVLVESVVLQWMLSLVNQKLLEKSKQRCLLLLHLLKVLVSLQFLHRKFLQQKL